MLHYETVNPKTLGLIKKLQKLGAFSELRLVGETSLALQMGHRRSIDIDLFGNIQASSEELSQIINQVGSINRLNNSNIIHIYLIDGVKVDIVKYNYKWLEEPVIENGLVLAGKKDIAAMKLNAITGRGTRKDFMDIYFLLKEYSIEDIFSFYEEKYHDGSKFLVLKSMLYFVDADKDDPCEMLIDINWNQVKSFIKEKVEEFIK